MSQGAGLVSQGVGSVSQGVGFTHVERVMGMAVSIDVRGVVAGDPTTMAVLSEVVTWLHTVDATFSTYIDDSEVRRLDRGELALADASPDVCHVLEVADALRVATNGYFDIRTSGGRHLDPSGVVKGWAVERASALLAGAGVVDHCINAGGDVRARGQPGAGRRWQIGIAHPLVAGALATIVAVGDGAVATSGTAERGAHVFDPHTGRAALDLASVTVTGPDLIRADAFATAALAMGLGAPEWLATLADHEAYVVDAGGHAWWTDGWPVAGSSGGRDRPASSIASAERRLGPSMAPISDAHSGGPPGDAGSGS